MTYKRLGQDLELSEEQLTKNLMFASGKIFDGMNIAIKPDESKRWFGVQPPDLSVIARSRGADWLYTYFLEFLSG
ncbi:MAG: hypothetical protein BMS9Abin15_0672 [Gammaproteobacteria bacterium]|nr:MAG: hypothetical protein BMS9Abin15_0672 [Gammaproteobacteria bacterium]